MYGSRRVSVLDRAAQAGDVVARATRLFFRLVTSRSRWTPTDLYAAAATARFMAAHDLVDRAEGQVGGDPEAELVQVRQPLWFGATTIHEEK